MHACFVNRFYFPDQSATAQLLTDLAEHLADVSENTSVTVVTSDLSYEGAALAAGEDSVNGVRVIRVRTTKFGRVNRIGRALDYATFYISAGLKLLVILRKDWVCVAKTDPPLISVVCGIACFLRRAILVNWVQDRFPEVALELGVPLPPGTYTVARLLRDWSTRYAAMNVAIGTKMANLVESCLLYTSPSPRDQRGSRMPSSA